MNSKILTFVCMIFISFIGIRITVYSQTSNNNEIWKITPIEIEPTDIGNGLTNYWVTFALENIGNQAETANLDLGEGTVQVEDGYSYRVFPFEPQVFNNLNNVFPTQFKTDFPLPSGFRTTGTYDYYGGRKEYRVFFQAASGLRLLQLTFPNWGDIDLTQIETPTYPTNRPNADFLTPGTSVEIPNTARITLSNPHPAGEPGENITVSVKFENLVRGYQTQVKVSCYLIDALGIIRHNTNVDVFLTPFEAGPGQTRETEIVFGFSDAQDAYYNTDKQYLNTAQAQMKIVCTGEFEAIYSIDMNPTSSSSSVTTVIQEATAPADTSGQVLPEVTVSNVTVDAQSSWQNTGITISQGSVISFRVVSGEWTYWKGTQPNSAGEGGSYICGQVIDPRNCVEPIPSAPTGALIGRVGEQSFLIGAGATVTSSGTGALELRINDADEGLYDNQGILTIEVQIRQEEATDSLPPVVLPFTLSDSCTAVESATLTSNSLPTMATCARSIFDVGLTQEESFTLAQVVYDCGINGGREFLELLGWLYTGVDFRSAAGVSFTSETMASCLYDSYEFLKQITGQ